MTPIGELRPGTIFEFDGKRYMRNKVSKGTVFSTPQWPGAGIFTDGLWLPKSQEVEVVDTSMALTPEQERET